MPVESESLPLIVQSTRIDYGHIYLETIVEEEEPSTSPAVDNKRLARSTKVCTLLSTLYLNLAVYHIFSNMSRWSFNFSDTSFFLRRVPHRPATKVKIRLYSISIFLLCIYQSPFTCLPSLAAIVGYGAWHYLGEYIFWVEYLNRMLILTPGNQYSVYKLYLGDLLCASPYTILFCLSNHCYMNFISNGAACVAFSRGMDFP